MSWRQYLLSKEYSYHRENGERLLLDGKLGEARVDFERAMQSLRQIKAIEEQGLESKLHSIAGKLANENLLKARELWAEGDLDDAFGFYQNALGVVSDAHLKDEILIEMSRLKLEMQPIEQIQVLERELVENPGEVDKHYELAMEYALSGYFEKAIFELKTVLEMDSENEECILRIGNACMDGKRLMDASEYYRKGLDLKGQLKAQFHFRLGQISVFSQETAEAESHFLATLELEGEHLDALMALARLYQSCLDWEKAIDYYERVLSLDPEDGETLLRVAGLWEERGFIKNAREIWEEVIEKIQDDICCETAKEKLEFYSTQF
jgi:tetratricopeptide (TPR) repeat protein